MATFMRAAAQAAVGEKNAVKVDRGSGLYVVCVANIADADRAGMAERLRLRQFETESRGEWLTIVPAAGWIIKVRDWLRNYSGEETPLMTSLGFGLNRAVAEPDHQLWLWGIKLLELSCAVSEKMAFERRVRQRAAEALRAGRFGGTLWDCAAICKLINSCEKNVSY